MNGHDSDTTNMRPASMSRGQSFGFGSRGDFADLTPVRRAISCENPYSADHDTPPLLRKMSFGDGSRESLKPTSNQCSNSSLSRLGSVPIDSVFHKETAELYQPLPSVPPVNTNAIKVEPFSTGPSKSARSARSVVTPFPLFASPHHDNSFGNFEVRVDLTDLRRTTSAPVKYSQKFFDDKADDPDTAFRILRRTRSHQVPDCRGLGVGVLPTIIESRESFSTLGSFRVSTENHVSLQSSASFSPAPRLSTSNSHSMPSLCSHPKPSSLIHFHAGPYVGSSNMGPVFLNPGAQSPLLSASSFNSLERASPSASSGDGLCVVCSATHTISNKTNALDLRRTQSGHSMAKPARKSRNQTKNNKLSRAVTVTGTEATASTQLSHTPPSYNPRYRKHAPDDSEPLPPPDDDEPTPPSESRPKQSLTSYIKLSLAKLGHKRAKRSKKPKFSPKEKEIIVPEVKSARQRSHITPPRIPHVTSPQGSKRGSPPVPITVPTDDTITTNSSSSKNNNNNNNNNNNTAAPPSRRVRMSSAPPTQHEIEMILNIMHHSDTQQGTRVAVRIRGSQDETAFALADPSFNNKITASSKDNNTSKQTAGNQQTPPKRRLSVPWRK